MHGVPVHRTRTFTTSGNLVDLIHVLQKKKNIFYECVCLFVGCDSLVTECDHLCGIPSRPTLPYFNNEGLFSSSSSSLSSPSLFFRFWNIRGSNLQGNLSCPLPWQQALLQVSRIFSSQKFIVWCVCVCACVKVLKVISLIL